MSPVAQTDGINFYAQRVGRSAAMSGSILPELFPPSVIKIMILLFDFRSRSRFRAVLEASPMAVESGIDRADPKPVKVFLQKIMVERQRRGDERLRRKNNQADAVAGTSFDKLFRTGRPC